MPNVTLYRNGINPIKVDENLISSTIPADTLTSADQLISHSPTLKAIAMVRDLEDEKGKQKPFVIPDDLTLTILQKALASANITYTLEPSASFGYLIQIYTGADTRILAELEKALKKEVASVISSPADPEQREKAFLKLFPALSEAAKLQIYNLAAKDLERGQGASVAK